MDFYQELLLTALISILLAVLLGKIAAAGGDEASGGDRPEAASIAVDLGLGRFEEAIAVKQLEESSEERLERAVEEKLSEVDEPGLGQISGEEIVQEVDIEKIEGDFLQEEKETVEKEVVEKGETLLHGEDEWEGIERSELEENFGVAVSYISSERGAEEVSKLGGDRQMLLYGLHKVATEGPCYESQPMALKVSARAKWQAWQKLGNMNPEVAMEQYVDLLSESIPGWMGEKPREEAEHSGGNDSPGTGVPKTQAPDLSPTLQCPPSSTGERFPEDSSSIEVDDAITGQRLSKQGLTKAFLLNLLSPTRVTFLAFY
ncbi:uncharacterized protein [Typha latifolia]|uniref:uncharacterized protein n=1 Tax=Typha latifolia TaxID=4733 RepID=UPI003C2E303D